MAHDSFAPHDHTACIRTGLDAASTLCDARGLRLTPVRRRVLELLLAEHRAMGAYDILEVLRAEGLGSQPPVVYRALEFLVAQRFVHRVERLNAFVACSTPEDGHRPTFLICRGCDTVAEAPLAPQNSGLDELAARQGFAVERVMVEVEGLCPKCQDPPQP
ncbi:MAG: Fur family transcriptional regulator [Pseudomonadota bacterium]